MSLSNEHSAFSILSCERTLACFTKPTVISSFGFPNLTDLFPQQDSLLDLFNLPPMSIVFREDPPTTRYYTRNYSIFINTFFLICICMLSHFSIQILPKRKIRPKRRIFLNYTISKISLKLSTLCSAFPFGMASPIAMLSIPPVFTASIPDFASSMTIHSE